MRQILRGLPVAALLLVAAVGCSDSDAGGPDQAADDSENSENTEGTEDTEASAVTPEAFCADVEALNEQFAADPNADTTAVIEAMESLDAPEEIADDLQTMVESARAQTEVDPEDTEAVAEIQEQLTAAGDEVNAFVMENCDFASPEGG
jgi:hypothetical protein